MINQPIGVYSMSNQAQQPTIFGAVTSAVTASLSAVTNGAKMVDNAMCAGERITYIAKSKASNLAEISDVSDTLKLVVAKKELKDKMDELGVSVDEKGNMSF